MKTKQAIDEFLFYMEVENNVSEHTLRSYAYDLHLFFQFLENIHGTVEVDEIRTSTVRRFIQEQVIHRKTKARTMNRRISCLKSFSKFCLKENWITEDFMAGVVNPKMEKRLPVYMKLEELQQLIRHLEAQSGVHSARNELMFKLLATTGMRRQELVDLNWEHFDFKGKTVRVHGKGSKERIIPLHDEVLPLFDRYQQTLEDHQKHPSEPVFYSYKKVRLDPRSLHRIFKVELKKAGLPPHRFSLHHLRHTFASLLLQAQYRVSGNGVDGKDIDAANFSKKVDLKTLQELLGHESLETTSIYTHIDFEHKRKAIDSLCIFGKE
jgi:site-specific recombinase XerD